MESELKILSVIGESDTHLTQRDLSARADLSLGAVNLLLNKMIEKGLVKMERIRPRTVRYMLTPQGMMEKAKKTYDFIKRTYEGILLMKGELEQVVRELPENATLYLYGEDNEVCQMATLLLREMADSQGIVIKKLRDPEALGNNDTVIVWDSADEHRLAGHRCVNLLQGMI